MVKMKREDHPLYRCWRRMRERCNRPSDKGYKHYGGRGIKVADEWQNDFWMFVYHMGEKPSPQHSLDRVDNDWGYFPENCRWATKTEQTRNSRSSLNAKGYHKTRAGNYCATITFCGNGQHNKINLGTFDCPLMAHLKFREVRDAFQPNTKH